MFVIDFYMNELLNHSLFVFFIFQTLMHTGGKNSFCVAEIQQFFQTTGF